MLTRGEDVEAHALQKRGWSISAIARHLGRDRKTIAAYLNGSRVPGQRRKSGGDPFAQYQEYCRIRLSQDPHLLATTLLDELIELGYDGGYSTFTRVIRQRGLRPHCEPCQQATGRDVAIIKHGPGEETQWDWVHLPNPPKEWEWPHAEAYLLVGTLPCSGRWRGWLAPSMDQSHLIEALHEVCARLGGLTQVWRFDQMPTVFNWRTGDLVPSFAEVGKYYGVAVVVCRARRANRKGAVEKSNDTAAQRWWRTLADDLSPEQAQASLDAWCAKRGDVRVRWVEGIKSTVASVAAREPLAALPDRPFPAVLEVERIVSAQALVGFEGNYYSVPPGHRGQRVKVRRVLGAEVIDIFSAAGNTLARHRAELKGAHVVVRADEHVTALEKAVLAATGDDRAPCRRKKRIPPSAAALAEAARIRATTNAATSGQDAPSGDGMASVTDFAVYAQGARELRPGHSATDHSAPGQQAGPSS
jgi:transposase